MPRTTLPPRTRRRSSTPAVVIITLIVGLALLLNGWPFVVSLVGFSTASAIDPGPPSHTELIRLEPAPAPESRAGLCRERSTLVPRSDAWRCEVEGDTYDPCFEATRLNQPPAIVCGAEEIGGASGFIVAESAPAPASSSGIDPAQLGDLFYLVDRIGTPVKLVNGQYYAPFVDSVGQGVLVALSGMRAAGDLDGDGDDDMAVLLVADAADDRMFIYLGAVVNESGAPARTTAIELGDRVKVDNLLIQGGQILVSMTTHAVDDPECCPTVNVQWAYTLLGDRLYHYVDGWRIELQSGIQCLPLSPEEASTAGNAQALPFVYRCSDGSTFRSGLRPGKVWYAERLGQPAASVGDERSPAGTVRPYEPVVRLWQ